MLHPLARALDWLADGVALIGVGGRVLHANATFHAIAQRNDGIALNAGAIRLAGAAARTRLNAAIAAAFAARDPGHRSPATADFAVPRQDGALSYLVSLRPLLDPNGDEYGEPCAVMFVRDPLTYRSIDIGTLREVFGLTEAEARLAKSLQSGQATADYARERALSLNTVYTHLRHLKDKAGCSRMTELLRKLNELHLPLRPHSSGAAGRPPNGALDGFQPSPMLVTPGLRRLASPDVRSAALRPV
jgi:DNA-binding CsgD family transcriptional regulator